MEPTKDPNFYNPILEKSSEKEKKTEKMRGKTRRITEYQATKSSSSSY